VSVCTPAPPHAIWSGSPPLAATFALATITHDIDGERRWWVPEDLSGPPSTEPVPAAPVQFTREDVDRVLRDL